LHDIQLSPEDNSRPETYSYKRGGKYPNPPRPSRHYEITVGFLLLGAATAAVFVAFKGAEYADYRCPATWWLPLLGGMALAVWLANHALGYLAG